MCVIIVDWTLQPHSGRSVTSVITVLFQSIPNWRRNKATRETFEMNLHDDGGGGDLVLETLRRPKQWDYYWPSQGVSVSCVSGTRASVWLMRQIQTGRKWLGK